MTFVYVKSLMTLMLILYHGDSGVRCGRLGSCGHRCHVTLVTPCFRWYSQACPWEWVSYAPPLL